MRAAMLGVLAALLLATPAHAADAVVGFIDTGINPYHKEFRDPLPRAYQHPSTYLPGFPKEAEALNLTFGTETWEDAVKADCQVWKNVSAGKLYWIPGTKIVGAIAFRDKPETIDCEEGDPSDALILDTNGHGTMVASRGSANEYGSCKQCLIVSIHYPNDGLEEPAPYQDALRWAAANRTWIDAQSNSWGPLVPGFEPTGTNIVTSNPPLIRTIEATASVQPAFWASMNGAAGRFGALGHPTPLSPHLTPSVFSVGGHDSGYMTLWTGFPPHLAADACNAMGAYHDKIKESDGTVSGGTSGATPYIAGAAAQILYDARRILASPHTGFRGDVVAQGRPGRMTTGPLVDGVFTLAEWRRVMLVGANPRPMSMPEDAGTCFGSGYDATPVHWSQVPQGYPEYLHIGYGALDLAGVTTAGSLLSGRLAEEPDRSSTDAYFAQDDAVRRQLHAEYTLGQAEEPPAQVPLPDGTVPPTPAPPATPSANDAPAKPAAKAVKLARLVKVTCARGKLLVRLKPGFKSAKVTLGKAKSRSLKARATLRFRAPKARRTAIVVSARDRSGKLVAATGAVGRCTRR